MNRSPQRRKAITGFTTAPVLRLAVPASRLDVPVSRRSRRLCAALLIGALAVLAFAGAPRAQAFTGGAASAAPTAADTATTAESTTTTAFDEAELSFTPLRLAGASWYGGKTMWGRSTACGQILRPTTIGVANKRLRCGTPVKFVWHGRSIIAPVIDRGPYIRGRAWDLTAAAAEALEFEGVGRIRYAVAIEYARTGL